MWGSFCSAASLVVSILNQTTLVKENSSCLSSWGGKRITAKWFYFWLFLFQLQVNETKTGFVTWNRKPVDEEEFDFEYLILKWSSWFEAVVPRLSGSVVNVPCKLLFTPRLSLITDIMCQCWLKYFFWLEIIQTNIINPRQLNFNLDHLIWIAISAVTLTKIP